MGGGVDYNEESGGRYVHKMSNAIQPISALNSAPQSEEVVMGFTENLRAGPTMIFVQGRLQ